jgi:hypothetical protein
MQRINELYEIHQALEALSSLAPHIANYLDGLITAKNTKDQVLGMLGSFKGYRDSLPQPIFRAMEIVVPGFRTIEDFESKVLQMSEEELDRRLGKLLMAIQSGRLAGSAMSEARSSANEDVRKRGNKWCAYVDDKLTKAEKEGNPKKYKGKKVGSVQRTPSGKIRMKARACYASKKKANNAMAAAMMESSVTSAVRSVVREMILQEDEAARMMNANLATHMATKVKNATDRRMFGRIMKGAWRKEADHASFKNVTFVHWNSFNNIVNLLSNPRGRDEISTFPYRTPPLKPFSLGWSNIYGVILKGHPTIIANADLNSNAFRRAGIPDYDMEKEKQAHREKSSGWNKYPGPKSPGSEQDFYDDFSTQLARSWEDHLVYSADEIMPAEKINFDARAVFSPSAREAGDVSMGWPEALLDNWGVEGIVVPDERIQEVGIDEVLDSFKRHDIPSGIPIYDERGEERSVTR